MSRETTSRLVTPPASANVQKRMMRGQTAFHSTAHELSNSQVMVLPEERLRLALQSKIVGGPSISDQFPEGLNVGRIHQR